MKFKFIYIVLFALIITSCERDVILTDEDLTEENDDLVEQDSDYSWDENDVIYITLNGDSITSSSGAIINGSILTINSAGTYNISGSLNDGQIIVNVSDDELVRLLFDGVNINCSSNAAVNIIEADKVIIYLVENTDNYVSDGSTYSSSVDPTACIYSKADLTIFGEGELYVTANYNDGITCKDGLLIKSGYINVDAIDDGIIGKDYLIIEDANIIIDADDDGLKSSDENGYILFESGTVNITAAGDAIQSDYDITINNGIITINAGDDAIHAENEIIIEDGTINVNSSIEGIEAVNITVNNGTINVAATDDGFNATQGEEVMSDDGSQLTVNGGTITVNMSGSDVDAMDSNGDITINNGTVNLNIPTSGPSSSLDANGTITIGSNAQVYENGVVYSGGGSGPGGH